MTSDNIHRQQADHELSELWRTSGETILDKVLAHGLGAVAHALLAIAGGATELEPLLALQRQYKSRETDTRYGGQKGPHAAGYALGMKHAADLLGNLLDDLDAG